MALRPPPLPCHKTLRCLFNENMGCHWSPVPSSHITWVASLSRRVMEGDKHFSSAEAQLWPLVDV